MKTERVVVDPHSPDPKQIDRAADLLCKGQPVAFPTETVYGLGAKADDASAVARVFEAKGRPAWNPLIVHAIDTEQAREYLRSWNNEAEQLAGHFWPGPLTLILPREKTRVPDAVTAGGDSVAVRVPAHPVTRALIEATGFALAAPSANRFQQISPVTADHVLKSLDGRIPMVLDAGQCKHGMESTVVDLTGSAPAVLRFGAVAIETLRAIVPNLEVRVAVRHADTASPGTAERHYAPNARLVIVARGQVDAARDELTRDTGGRIATIRFGTTTESTALDRTLPHEPAAYAARLYDTLHGLDDAGADAIVIEAPDDAPGWEAVRDRLQRGSA